MWRIKPIGLASQFAILSVIIGIAAIAMNWHLFNGNLPGYSILLFPGNLTLEFIWHPLLTEEIDFWPKLFLHMLGQFYVVYIVTLLLLKLIKSQK